MAPSGEISPAPKVGSYFPALDGLRAVSVLAVIAYHAELTSVPGGFLGVEVFFVVSGYLITALLLHELRETGRISLPRFWLRRARRLLPALFALLLAALAASLFLAPDALEATRSDALAALFYVSNWWQIVHHHSYFMVVQRPPLLLQLWSLAVEEQFYLFWPLLIVSLGRLTRRWLLPVSLGGALASAVWLWQLFDPTLDPTRVYIGTDCRLSGLLFGAALAAVTRAPLTRTTPSTGVARVSQEALAVVGAAVLLGAFARVTSHDSLVYRGGLVLVDLASCALLSALVAPTFTGALFGARPLAWLGRRSYGLYLWHWPIFALTRAEQDVPWSGLRLLVLRLGLTLAFSEACYRYLEMPIRRGALPGALRRLRARPLLLALSTALAATAAVGLVSLSSSRLAAARLESERSVATTPEGSAVALGNAAVSTSPTPGNASTSLVPASHGVALDPAWPKTLTLLSDSVTLAVAKSLPLALPGWRVEVLGRPALMVKQVVPEFLNARSVGSVVVIGLAYNSLFEKDRKNYERWAGLWDRSAERLLSDLKACGAKKIVWVTLREPAPELVTDAGRDQYRDYAWFFPYVNERIRALSARHPELSIADWRAVSNVPGITKDLIHLNPTGVTLMTDTITHAVLEPNATH